MPGCFDKLNLPSIWPSAVFKRHHSPRFRFIASSLHAFQLPGRLATFERLVSGSFFATKHQRFDLVIFFNDADHFAALFAVNFGVASGCCAAIRVAFEGLRAGRRITNRPISSNAVRATGVRHKSRGPVIELVSTALSGKQCSVRLLGACKFARFFGPETDQTCNYPADFNWNSDEPMPAIRRPVPFGLVGRRLLVQGCDRQALLPSETLESDRKPKIINWSQLLNFRNFRKLTFSESNRPCTGPVRGFQESSSCLTRTPAPKPVNQTAESTVFGEPQSVDGLMEDARNAGPIHRHRSAGSGSR